MKEWRCEAVRSKAIALDDQIAIALHWGRKATMEGVKEVMSREAIAFFLGVELSALNHLLLDGLLLPLPMGVKERLKGD